MPPVRHPRRAPFLPFLWACCVLTLGWAAPGVAAPDWDELPRDAAEREALEAIARQPGALRDDALRVSGHPDLIVGVENIRAWSGRSFEEILEGRSQQERDDLWELARHPALVSALAREDATEAREILDRIAENVEDAARRAASGSHPALVEMDALHDEIEAAFADLLEGLEPSLADALERVADEPALLSVLAENLRTTVALGEAYASRPAEVQEWLAELSVEVAANDERERDEWSEAIREDPVLREQVTTVAADWEAQVGPRWDDYDQGFEDGYEEGHREGRSLASRVRPYPYWYGYPARCCDFFVPAAHAHALWYPRATWGHLGFHGHGHSLVVFAAPSFPFLYWLRAHHPSHHYVRRYSHHHRVRHVHHAEGIRRAHHAHRSHRHHDRRHHADRHRDRRRHLDRHDDRGRRFDRHDEHRRHFDRKDQRRAGRDDRDRRPRRHARLAPKRRGAELDDRRNGRRRGKAARSDGRRRGKVERSDGQPGNRETRARKARRERAKASGRGSSREEMTAKKRQRTKRTVAKERQRTKRTVAKKRRSEPKRVTAKKRRGHSKQAATKKRRTRPKQVAAEKRKGGRERARRPERSSRKMAKRNARPKAEPRERRGRQRAEASPRRPAKKKARHDRRNGSKRKAGAGKSRGRRVAGR